MLHMCKKMCKNRHFSDILLHMRSRLIYKRIYEQCDLRIADWRVLEREGDHTPNPTIKRRVLRLN